MDRLFHYIAPGIKARAAPSPPEGAVKLNHGAELAELGLRQRVLRREKQLLLLKHFVVAGLTAAIALGGDSRGLLVSRDGQGLLRAGFGQLLARDQCVGYFLECVQHRGLVLQGILVPRGLGLAILRDQLSALENGAGHLCRGRPGSGAAGSEH